MKPLFILVALSLATSLVGQEISPVEWRMELGNVEPRLVARHHWPPEAALDLPSGGWLLAWRSTFPETESTLAGSRIAKISPCGRQEWRLDLPWFLEPSAPIAGQDRRCHFLGVEKDEIIRLSVNEQGSWKKEATIGPAFGFRAFKTKDGGWLAFASDSRRAVRALRIDTSFETTWTRSLPDLSSVPATSEFIELEDGGFLIRSGPEFTILEADGNTRSRKVLWAGSDQSLTAMAAVPGGVVLLGETQRGGIRSMPFGSSDLWLLKLDLQGRLLWENVLGGTNVDIGSALVASADGSLTVLGRSQSKTLTSSGNLGRSWKRSSFIIAAQVGKDGHVTDLTSLFSEESIEFDPLTLVAVPASNGRTLVVAGFTRRSGTRIDHMGGLALLEDNLTTRWRHQFPACPPDTEPRIMTGECLSFSSLTALPMKSGVLVSGRYNVWNGLSELALFRVNESGTASSDCSARLRIAPGRTAHGAWSIPTLIGRQYAIETSPNMSPGTWTQIATFAGDGGEITFPGRTDARARSEFFRVLVQAP